ncbi:MAG TPA: oligosaccharide flippase family protein [Anaerolineae bacterium]|nr:oligosaccharide flippase family protein [Anaerolineae bacterium]
MLRRRLPTLLVLLGLFLLPVFLFWQVTLGGKTLLPADIPFQFAPWRSAAEQFDAVIPGNQLLADLILENYAWKRFVVESLRAGEIPLWNPYLFAGAPFLANGQASTLYPFSAIFYVLPLAQAYGWFTVSQLFLAGASMYVLGRMLGIGRFGSFFAAIVYQLSGFFVVSVVFTMIIAAAAWLPLLLAMIECVIQERPLLGRPATIPWAVIGAIGLGCTILAGHSEIVYYTLLVMAFFALWRLLSQRVSESASQPINQLTSRRLVSWLVGWLAVVRRPIGWLLLMVALGIGLGAVQLLPLGEVVTRNFREGSATLEQVRGWAWPPRHVLKFLMPNAYGNPAHHSVFDVFTWRNVPLTSNLFCTQQPADPTCATWDRSTHFGIKNYVEGGTYLGILPLLLAIFAVFRAQPTGQQTSRRVGRLVRWFKRPHVPFFTALALLSLAFAFGTALYAILYVLPGINQLHSPFRWVWPFTLSIATLAGFGIDALIRDLDRDRAARQARGLLRWFTLIAPVSLRTVLAGFAFWGGALLLVGLLVSRFVVPTQSLIAADRLLRSLALADRAFPNAELFYSYEWRNLLLLALFAMASGVILRMSLCPIDIGKRNLAKVPRFASSQGLPIWKPLAVGVLVLDLLIAGWGFNPAVDPALLDHEPPVVDFLRQDTSLWRFTTFDPHGRKTFNANLGWPAAFQDVRGYDSVILKQYADYMRVIDQQDELQYNRIAPLTTYGGLDSPMLDLLGVKYVLTDPDVPIESLKYRLVYDAEVKVYENLGAVPRAYVQTCAAGVEDQLDALRKIDPRTMLILDAGVPGPNPARAACLLQPATITSYAPSEVFVDVRLDQPAWLVLNDTYFAGWQAWDRLGGSVQETDLTIQRANGNFRAVQLQAGQHTVRFKYSPWSFKLGAFISFMSAMVIVCLVGVWLWRLAYREEAIAGSTVRRVAKNSLAPMLLTLFNRAIDFAFAALMLRILQPENVGNYALAVVIAGWVEILTNFGLNTLLTREVSKDHSQANRYLVNTSILRLILGGVSIPAVLLLLLIATGAPGLLGGNLTPETAITIVLLTVAQIPSSLSYGLTALFYANEKAEYPAAISVVTVMFKVLLGVPALLLGWGIVGLALVSLAVNVVTLLILARQSFRLFFKPRLESDPALRRGMVRESFPLMLNHLLATLFFKIDIPLLYSLQGPTVVGLYSAAYKWVDALNIIPAYSTIALFPVMSRQAGDDRAALLRSYRIGVRLLVALALPLAVATTFVAPLLMLILGGHEYLPHSATALQIMIWSIPFGWINSITNYVLIAAGQQSKLTRAFVIGLVFNVVANLILIPRYSYVAAAVVTIMAELVEGLAFQYYVEKSVGVVLWIRMLWKFFASAAAMFAVTWALWPVSGVVALGAGIAVYGAGVWGLKAFGPEERAVFAELKRSRSESASQRVGEPPP